MDLSECSVFCESQTETATTSTTSTSVSLSATTSASLPFFEGTRSFFPPLLSISSTTSLSEVTSSDTTTASPSSPTTTAKASPTHNEAGSGTVTETATVVETHVETTHAVISTDFIATRSSSLSISIITPIITESVALTPETQTTVLTQSEVLAIALGVGAVLVVMFASFGVWLTRRRRVQWRGSTEEGIVTAWRFENSSVTQATPDRPRRMRALLDEPGSERELPPPYSEPRLPTVSRVWRGKL